MQFAKDHSLLSMGLLSFSALRSIAIYELFYTGSLSIISTQRTGVFGFLTQFLLVIMSECIVSTTIPSLLVTSRRLAEWFGTLDRAGGALKNYVDRISKPTMWRVDMSAKSWLAKSVLKRRQSTRNQMRNGAGENT